MPRHHLPSKPMPLLKKTAAVLAVIGFASACIPLSGGREYRSKRVASKLAGSLTAYDTMTCSVSAEDFARVQVGEQHRCVWVPQGPSKLGGKTAPGT